MIGPRLRTKHVFAFAALCGLAGWAAARSTESHRPSGIPDAPAQTETPIAPPPADPVARPANRPRRRFRTGRVTLLTGLVALLVFASVGFSAGPDDRPRASAPAVDLRAAVRIAARATDRAGRDAENARLRSLRTLQLAGIASRPTSLAPREADRVRRLAALRLIPVPRPSERAVALERYIDALGADTLLTGLEDQRGRLQERVLSDPRIHIDSGGDGDVASGRLDIRILALLEYLAETHGQVTVSCLITGHSHYVRQSEEDKKLKRPRRVSAHIYGRAVDISAVGGIPISGNQQPGGITEQTIREILSLPSVVVPKQVISLLSLGGPSFPLPDHGDHIHVGY